MAQTSIELNIGRITLSAENGFITGLSWHEPVETAGSAEERKILAQALEQLKAYDDGELTEFNLPLKMKGTAYQLKAWAAIASIPFGQFQTYGEVAQSIQSGPRAIGSACRTNPIAVIVPCHRVLAADKKIGGFSAPGGLATKEFLLAHEQRVLSERKI